MEQFQTDLNSERAALQKMESAKLTLEKQVKETKRQVHLFINSIIY